MSTLSDILSQYWQIKHTIEIGTLYEQALAFERVMTSDAELEKEWETLGDGGRVEYIDKDRFVAENKDIDLQDVLQRRDANDIQLLLPYASLDVYKEQRRAQISTTMQAIRDALTRDKAQLESLSVSPANKNDIAVAYDEAIAAVEAALSAYRNGKQPEQETVKEAGA